MTEIMQIGQIVVPGLVEKAKRNHKQVSLLIELGAAEEMGVY